MSTRQRIKKVNSDSENESSFQEQRRPLPWHYIEPKILSVAKTPNRERRNFRKVDRHYPTSDGKKFKQLPELEL